MNNENTNETEQIDEASNTSSAPKARPGGSRHVVLDRDVELPDYDCCDLVYGEDGAGPTYDEYSQVRPRKAAEPEPKSKLAKLRGSL